MARLSQVQKKLLISISREWKLWISPISSKSLKILISDRGLYKNEYKGQRKKGE
jgi:hypothetical protein